MASLTMRWCAGLLGMLVFLLPRSAIGQEGGWQKEWNQIIAAAQREGKVVVVGPPDAPLRRELPSAFREKFGIPLEYTGARGAENEAKLSMERRAGFRQLDRLERRPRPSRSASAKVHDSQRCRRVVCVTLGSASSGCEILRYIHLGVQYHRAPQGEGVNEGASKEISLLQAKMK